MCQWLKLWKSLPRWRSPSHQHTSERIDEQFVNVPVFLKAFACPVLAGEGALRKSLSPDSAMEALRGSPPFGNAVP